MAGEHMRSRARPRIIGAADDRAFHPGPAPGGPPRLPSARSAGAPTAAGRRGPGCRAAAPGDRRAAQVHGHAVRDQGVSPRRRPRAAGGGRRPGRDGPDREAHDELDRHLRRGPREPGRREGGGGGRARHPGGGEEGAVGRRAQPGRLRHHGRRLQGAVEVRRGQRRHDPRSGRGAPPAQADRLPRRPRRRGRRHRQAAASRTAPEPGGPGQGVRGGRRRAGHARGGAARLHLPRGGRSVRLGPQGGPGLAGRHPGPARAARADHLRAAAVGQGLQHLGRLRAVRVQGRRPLPPHPRRPHRLSRARLPLGHPAGR